jgi:uncharacterized membrane protein
VFPTMLQILGILVISLGLGLIYAPIGVISLGVGIVLFGLAWERVSYAQSSSE